MQKKFSGIENLKTHIKTPMIQNLNVKDILKEFP
jgi:hypothetical protein